VRFFSFDHMGEVCQTPYGTAVHCIIDQPSGWRALLSIPGFWRGPTFDAHVTPPHQEGHLVLDQRSAHIHVCIMPALDDRTVERDRRILMDTHRHSAMKLHQ